MTTHFKISTFLLLCSVTLTACLVAPSPTATRTLNPIATLIPTITLTPTPRSQGPTSTPWPSPTPPPVLPSPLHPLPTLTAEETRTYVERMLDTNGDCELPCWWGVVPGEPTLQTLQKFNTFYGKPLPQSDGTVVYGVGFFVVENSEGQPDYSLSVNLLDQSGTIAAIEVDSSIRTVSPNKNFMNAWKRYSLGNVLSHYGIPSQARVMFAPPAEVGSSPEYRLTLIYEKIAFGISYAGRADYDVGNGLMRACPTLANTNWISLHIRSTTIKLRSPFFLPDPAGYDLPLEDATGISLEDFYQQFRNSSNKTCLQGKDTIQP